MKKNIPSEYSPLLVVNGAKRQKAKLQFHSIHFNLETFF